MSYWRFIRLIVIKNTHKILVQLLCHFYSCAYVIPDVELLSDGLSSQWHPAQSKIPSQQAGLESQGNPLNGLTDGTVYNRKELLRADPENFNKLYILLLP